jgi:acyl-coenzyme A synthetase/AMP-(fatty) acid ligase/acyl carrier protein
VPLCAGGTVCIPAGRELLMEPYNLADWIDQNRISLIHTVPSIFRSLLRAGLSPDQFPSLQYVLLSGEVLLPSDISKWTSIFGKRIQLVNLYGPSETTMIKLFHRVQSGDEKRRSIPIGKPISNTQVITMDSNGKVCPPGIPGELYIRTPYRSLGYYDQPEATSQSFIPNPFGSDPGDVTYKTGDLARLLPDGTFEYFGRLDHQVKLGGVRIEIGEIESRLLEIPGIHEAAVIFRDRIGDGHLSAYVMGEPVLNPAELKKLLARSLELNMIPAEFVFVHELPKTPSGKIDRSQLENWASQPAPASTLVEPSTRIEKELIDIWKTVLAAETLSVEDNFFAIGGHSLAAMQVLAHVASGFQVSLSVIDFFHAPTIKAMAEQIESALIANSTPTQLDAILDRLEQIDDDVELRC